MEIIRIDNVQKRFGKVEAVRGVSLSISEGELFGLIGPDGAGKTTLMRSMCTLLEPDSGHILIGGLDVTKNVTRIRSNIGYMPQRFSLYPDLSVEQNLRFFAELFEVPAADREKHMQELYRFSRLEPFKKREAAALSGGMKQKLALSCALIHRPDIFVLDEPTFGVDPISRTEFWNMLRSIRDEGKTIVVSTAYMDEADLCDRVALLFEGETIALGTPGELKESYRYPLYRIAGRDVRRLRDFFREVPSVHDTRLFGDSIHVSFDEEPAETAWLEWRTSLRGELERWEREEPSIEDVFLDLIGSG
jgi:ABC-2 type transport system ATP-binding protein